MDIETRTIFSKEIDDLLNKEKNARLNNDFSELNRLLPQIIKIAFDAKEYYQLNELIKLLAKKRGQSKKAQIDMVQLAMKYIDQLPTMDLKTNLINAIKEVTEKKIFLEVEYARCCLMLVKMNENESNIDEAAKILQDVQVETYGSMDKREKLEFILYQMKIMIKKRDFVRLIIISRKINKKNLEDAGIEDLKITYYSYLILYYTHENKFFENAECYKAIYDTLRKKKELLETLPKVLEFNFSLSPKNLLENYVLYLVINTHTPQQVQHLTNLRDSYADDLETYLHLKHIVNSILSTELISVKPEEYDLSNLELFTKAVENSEGHAVNFRKQLIQHNLRIIGLYYERISIKRMNNLVGVDADTCEAELCEMINNKLVNAKINRPDNVVNFKRAKNENEILNSWRSDIHKILDLVDHTANLINREYDVENAA